MQCNAVQNHLLSIYIIYLYVYISKFVSFARSSFSHPNLLPIHLHQSTMHSLTLILNNNIRHPSHLPARLEAFIQQIPWTTLDNFQITSIYHFGKTFRQLWETFGTTLGTSALWQHEATFQSVFVFIFNFFLLRIWDILLIKAKFQLLGGRNQIFLHFRTLLHLGPSSLLHIIPFLVLNQLVMYWVNLLDDYICQYFTLA